MFTVSSDAGGDALKVLGEAAVLPIANMNEAGFHVADGLWKGETEEEIWWGNEFTARPDAGGAAQTRLTINTPPFATN